MSDLEVKDSPYAALKLPDFRRLLLGRLFVTLAVQIQGLAVGWQVYELTKSPLVLGCIGLAEALPSLGVALYAGHIADVHDRTKIALIAVLGLFLSMLGLTLGSQFMTGMPLVVLIFAIIAFSGIARGFYGPAVFGIASDVVPRPLLANSAAWNSTSWQGSAMLGPVLGGFLYVGVGGAWTYGIATALLTLSLAIFLTLKNKSQRIINRDVSVIANIKEGLQFVFSNQIILGAMALDLFAVLFGGAVALLPVFSAEIFHYGPQALGFLRAAPPLGAMLTAGILAHLPIKSHAGRIFMSCVAGFGLCIIGFGLSKNYYVSLFFLTLSGMLDCVGVYIRGTIYQLLTPDDMKGRVASVNSMFIGSSNEIGEFESGVAARFMGLVPSVIFGGTMTLLVVLFTAFKAPKLRDLHLQNLYLKESK